MNFEQVKKIVLEHYYAVSEGNKTGYTGMSYEQGLVVMIELLEALEDGDENALEEMLDQYR